MLGTQLRRTPSRPQDRPFRACCPLVQRLGQLPLEQHIGVRIPGGQPIGNIPAPPEPHRPETEPQQGEAHSILVRSFHSNKSRIHLRGPTCHLISRLRERGGPSIPSCLLHIPRRKLPSFRRSLSAEARGPYCSDYRPCRHLHSKCGGAI